MSAMHFAFYLGRALRCKDALQRTYNCKGEFKQGLRGGLPARFMWGCVTGYQVQSMALGGRHYMALVGL